MSDKERKSTYSALTGFHRSVPIILSAVALFLGLCLLIPDMGILGTRLAELMRGLFARGAYAIPLLMLLQAGFYPSDVGHKRVISRLIFSLITTLAVSCLCYAISYFGTYGEIEFSVKQFYADGLEGLGGGAVGGIISKGLTDLISPVGVIILAAAVMALYVSYFFAGSMKAINKASFAVLRAVISFFALIERGIKSLVRSGKDRKGRKKVKREERKNLELSQDEFFGVDNGMAALEISELGIKQMRSGSDIEQNPTLHEKVFPKSATGEQQSEEELREVEEEQITVNEEAEQPKRRVVYGQAFSVDGGLMESTEQPPERNDAIIIEEPAEQEQIRDNREAADNVFEATKPEGNAERKESTARDDAEGADGVFGRDFDPFSLAMSAKLANKPSSKGGAAPAPSVTEDISELTEEDVERARKIKAFEERKKAILQMHGHNEATPVSNKGEFTGKAKNIEFHEVKGEVVKDPTEAEEISMTIDKGERVQEQPRPVRLSFTEVGFEEQGKPEEQREGVYGFGMPSHVAQPVRPAYTESINRNRAESVGYGQSADNDRPNPYAGAINAQQRAATMAAPEPQQRAQEPSTNGYARAAEFSAQSRGDTPSIETNRQAQSFNFGIKEEKGEPAEQPVQSFDFGADGDEDEDDGVIETAEQVTIERTPIREQEPVQEQSERRAAFGVCDGNLTVGYDEDEDEDEDIEDGELDGEQIAAEDGDDEEFEPIPLEKQNPVVRSYRDMFPDLRSDEQSDEEDEDEDGQSADAESDGDAEDGEEDDECPFDGGVDTEESLADIVEEMEDAPPIKKKADYSNYRTPPLELLGLSGSQDDEEIAREIRDNTNILIETLASFNVTASIKGVDRGPRITRYEVVPAKGVKVNAITHLFDDISLNLAAEGIRMEAPIPGKSAIGFEIPNKHPADVRLRELLECEEFVSSKSNTFVCIGKDVAGKPVFGDIAKFPHCLVAGATGMGKSVCINSIMISILYKARPDQVKFIMIDPKKVEFKLYTGIPHLLIPVITESKQAAGALMWAVEEMERRYDIIEKHSLRNIEGYNEKVAEDPSLGEPLPKIIIVIDELNDLMMQVRDPVEDLIMRIAQKARAAGIHLIIGTQRPDVKVITGTIKANINTRISCKVTSVVDSRTILEMAGAEKLLNKGDMLFKPTDKTKPIRVQGAFVKDSEAEAVMSFLRSEVSGDQYDDEIFKEINKAAQKCGNKKGGGAAAMDEDGDDGESLGCYNDQQFLDAVELAIRSRKVSTSLLQRKLSIGYGKAAKYIDQMMDIGIVSEPNGQKPRDVLITLDEWQDKLSRVSLD